MRTGVTRRQVLIGLGGAIGASVAPPPLWLQPTAEAAPLGFETMRPIRAAMHVHGSWSDGLASWEAQFTQAVKNGYNVLYMTDGDARWRARSYLTSLSGAAWNPVITSGTLRRKTVLHRKESLRLLAESGNAAAASITLSLQELDGAATTFRTSVSGLTITQRIHTAKLTNGAQFEVVIPLSYHPGTSNRPAGNYTLIYRFGGAARRFTESNGLVGVVGAPAPAAGSTQLLNPRRDIAAIWPDMHAADNVSYGLSFLAKSPRAGAVCDVTIASMAFGRARSTPGAVVADQAALISAYQARFPSLTVMPTWETGPTLPGMTPFGIAPWIPNYSRLSPHSTTAHQQIADEVHVHGGLISYAHPFGYDTGPLLSAPEREAKRRRVFASMQAVNRFSADLLEVGYNMRGQVDTLTHLALWDTFSRNGNFLTGNGVSDDHSGLCWNALTNGFGTGIWATLPLDSTLTAAMSAGRVFAAHFGHWPKAELDLLVDDTVPMGGVSISEKNMRNLAIWAAHLPAGSTVQVVGGPVDYLGSTDPGTWVKTTLTPADFSGGLTSLGVSTVSSRFFRVQVLDSAGTVIGASNPVYLLRSEPPNGVPPARRAP